MVTKGGIGVAGQETVSMSSRPGLESALPLSLPLSLVHGPELQVYPPVFNRRIAYMNISFSNYTLFLKLKISTPVV